MIIINIIYKQYFDIFAKILSKNILLKNLPQMLITEVNECYEWTNEDFLRVLDSDPIILAIVIFILICVCCIIYSILRACCCCGQSEYNHEYMAHSSNMGMMYSPNMSQMGPVAYNPHVCTRPVYTLHMQPVYTPHMQPVYGPSYNYY